jgi:hypothetical protein
LLVSINELGQQGWELVDVLYYKDIKGAMAWTAFLKRPSPGQVPATPNHVAGNSAKALPTAPTEEKPSQPQGFDLSGDEFQLKTE